MIDDAEQGGDPACWSHLHQHADHDANDLRTREGRRADLAKTRARRMAKAMQGLLDGESAPPSEPVEVFLTETRPGR